MEIAITKAQARLIGGRQAAVNRAQRDLDAVQDRLDAERASVDEVLAQLMADGGVREDVAIERWSVGMKNGKPVLTLVETPQPASPAAG